MVVLSLLILLFVSLSHFYVFSRYFFINYTALPGIQVRLALLAITPYSTTLDDVRARTSAVFVFTLIS